MARYWVKPALQSGSYLAVKGPAGALLDTTMQGAFHDDSGWLGEMLAETFPGAFEVATDYVTEIKSIVGLVAYWPLVTDGSDVAAGLYPATANAGFTFGSPGLLQDTGDLAASNDGGISSGANIGGTFSNLGFPGFAPFSCEAWVENTGAVSGQRHILSAMNSATAGTSGGWRVLLNSSGAVNFSRYGVDAVNDVALTASNTILYGTNNVYHVVGSFDGTYLRVYVNGALAVTSAAAVKSMPALTVAPKIARVNYGTGSAWQGRVGHVAVYSRALAPAEIMAHYGLGITVV